MNDTPGHSFMKSRAGIRAAQFAFILWLLCVNVFYYLQFRDVFLARVASRIHR
jgi:hypothetical protein